MAWFRSAQPEPTPKPSSWAIWRRAEPVPVPAPPHHFLTHWVAWTIAGVTLLALAGGALIRRHVSQRAAFEARKDKMRARRERIARELLSTEQSYLDQLDTIVLEYLNPLREEASSGRRNAMIRSEQIKAIFSYIEILRGVNMELERALAAVMAQFDPDTTCIGAAFLKVADHMRVYATYISSFDDSRAALASAYRESKRLRLWVENQQDEAKVHLPLEALLITPVQRCPRYVLLLADLVKSTWPSHPDYQSLVQSLEKAKEVTKHLNDRKRDSDSRRAVRRLEEQINGLPESLVSPTRWLEREGDVVLGDGKRRFAFVLSDQLILVKPVPLSSLLGGSIYKFKSQFSFVQGTTIEASQVVDSPAVEKKSGERWRKRPDSGHTIVLTQPELSLTFVYSSEAERDVWFDALRRLIPKGVEAKPKGWFQTIVSWFK